MNENEHYLLFLQMSDELPPSFFHLAEKFSRYHIKLIPVQAADLLSLNENSRQYLITQVTDLTSFNRFRELRRRFLDIALMNKRLFLFDVSSFGPVVLADRMERLGTYCHYPLPLSFETLARSIAGVYYREKEQHQRWPGGRRGRLPSLIGD